MGLRTIPTGRTARANSPPKSTPKSFRTTTDYRCFSLRYGITYGPREWYGRVLTIFLKRLLEGKAPVVFGAGEQLRDFVYVADVVRIHRACVESDLQGAHSFNGGTGIATSIARLAKLVCEVTGSDLEPVTENVSPAKRPRLVDDACVYRPNSPSCTFRLPRSARPRHRSQVSFREASARMGMASGQPASLDDDELLSQSGIVVCVMPRSYCNSQLVDGAEALRRRQKIRASTAFIT